MRPSLLIVFLVSFALAFPLSAQETQPASEPVKEGDLAVGDGEALPDDGAYEVSLQVWMDAYDGRPYPVLKTVVAPMDSEVFPGLGGLMKGMKVGGKRRTKVLASDLVAPSVLPRMRMAADQMLFLEIVLDKVWAAEEFGIETTAEGTGDRTAKPGDYVLMHYTGWTDGFGGDKKFDSSHDRNSPFSFTLGDLGVIAGWERGVAGMKKGEKRRLSIPHYLAYGNRAMGDKIAEYSRLYFEIDLVDFIDLGIETIKEGEGPPTQNGDALNMHYTGWLDGFGGDKKFDSSRDRGQPFSFTIGRGQVIQGWEEGLLGMKPGEIRRLTIPYQLAYGPKGRPPTIPPEATLYFEVEYLGPKE